MPATQPRVPIDYRSFGSESDPGPFPIPLDAPIEGGAASSGDRHVLVVQQGSCELFELFGARRSGNGWSADSGARFDLRSNELRPLGWTSADAAGLAILPGLVRYDEVAGGEIRHAIRITFSRTRAAYILPATHFASNRTDTDLPPMGMRLRLRASFDVSRLTGQSRVIAVAMQRYGVIVADNGSNWFFQGAPNAGWDDDDLGSSSRSREQRSRSSTPVRRTADRSVTGSCERHEPDRKPPAFRQVRALSLPSNRQLEEVSCGTPHSPSLRSSSPRWPRRAFPSIPAPAASISANRPTSHPWSHLPTLRSFGDTRHRSTTTTAARSTTVRPPTRGPALEAGLQPLRLWVADPDNGRTDRPAIIWIHGGGFAYGIDSMYQLANTTGKAYARRGYVSFSIEYRIDTTVVPGDGTRSPSLCQWVQDHAGDGDPAWPARSEQCRRNVDTALHDALGAVRWVRAHADEFGIDPTKVAVAGFSAGAVTAANTAYRNDEVGTVSYFDGDTRAATDSAPQAVFGASGCSTGDAVGVPADVDGGDAPVSFIQSEFDAALPYACAKATIEAARAAGVVAELTSYCGEAGHANSLYSKYLEATDEQWTTFLARELNLYLAMPDAADDPFC